MSDEEDVLLPADAEDSLVESTEVDNPVEDADTAAMQSEENIINGLAPGSDPAEEPADDDENMDDLLGDDDGDDDDVEARPKKRRLDDEELDSGDDLDRDDRMIEDDEAKTPPAAAEEQELTMAEIELPRHGTLKGSDGELYLLHNPIYTGIEPKAFQPSTFRPPATPHHSGAPPSSNFSAAQTAATTMRWRRSPADPAVLQSNSRIIRWSDGSLTLQIGSSALEQYELPGTGLAPPQANPRKATPISRLVRKGAAPPRPNPRAESHTYLASINEEVNIARIAGHITATLNVRNTATAGNDEADDALLKLQESMAATVAAKRGGNYKASAGSGSGGGGGGGLAMVKMEEDPDEARKRAEKAEKEKARAQKQKQQRIDREQARREDAMGRASGFGRSARGGLTAGLLEDDDGGAGGGGRERGPGAAPRKRAPPKKRTKRNNDYSDDEEEEEYRKGRTREDEYDEADDFIAPSDEDEIIEGDDDEEDILDDDADADGEADDEPVQSVEKGEDDAGAGRGRRRHVVDDDDDD